MGIWEKFTSKKKGSEGVKKDVSAVETEPVKKSKAAKSKSAEAPKATRGPLARQGGGSAHRVLRAPLFTEKTGMQHAIGQYTFLVAPSANKLEVAAAVKDLYGVKPVAIRIVVSKGKNVRFGRTMGREKNQKKAIVTLKPGEVITLVEG
jgi:large subunit ribosomal protein L23